MVEKYPPREKEPKRTYSANHDIPCHQIITSNTKPSFSADISTPKFYVPRSNGPIYKTHQFHSMNILQSNLRLSARNEGKIKSFESCSDVRAWSHDVSKRDRYLREWMKCDMPVCVIPVSTLTVFLRTMTCRSRRKVAPRCHRDCKSKVLLESICTSCHAMRECLKQDENFEKYFVEEELETSQWPCERCLDALKSIKMYWKVIIDKILNISLSKYGQYETDCNSGDSVRSIAKAWQSEMIQQAMYVKNVTPELSTFSCSSKRDKKPDASQRNIKTWPAEEKYYSRHIARIRQTLTLSPKPEKEIRPDKEWSGILKKYSRSTSMVIETADVACDTCFFEQENEEIKAHKKNLQVLQEKCNGNVEEVDRLKRENNSLRIELENVYKSCPWKASFYCPDSHSHSMPKPFEVALEDSRSSSAKNIDSEMVITMKKCRHENFRHVSLLQVLHKSNEQRVEDSAIGPSKKDDPIEILTKVHNTFGAIVKREMSIINERRHRPKKQASDVEATFHKINTSKSAPSCSTLSSSRFSSELNFVSNLQKMPVIDI